MQLANLGEGSLLAASHPPWSAQLTVRSRQGIGPPHKEQVALQGEEVFFHPYHFQVTMYRRGRSEP